MTNKLALFDCDGTLVDGQHGICAAMATAFADAGLAPPSRPNILSVVGLSLPSAMARLIPDGEPDLHQQLTDRYKLAFQQLRRDNSVHEPLFDGMADLLDRLEADGWLLGIATGKSDRGLSILLDAHGLTRRFVTLQTADRHPSKPHPSMANLAMAEAGAEPHSTVMIGDTSFDMEMAIAAGCRPLGVGWGYHPPEHLIAVGAHSVAMDSEQLYRHIAGHD